MVNTTALVPSIDFLHPLEKAIARDAPAAPPPPGIVPNFQDPPNLRAVGQFVIIFCFLLATAALIVRVYTKLFIIRRFTVSDCRFLAMLLEYMY